jgi:hypothetical protein
VCCIFARVDEAARGRLAATSANQRLSLCFAVCSLSRSHTPWVTSARMHITNVQVSFLEIRSDFVRFWVLSVEKDRRIHSFSAAIDSRIFSLYIFGFSYVACYLIVSTGSSHLRL